MFPSPFYPGETEARGSQRQGQQKGTNPWGQLGTAERAHPAGQCALLAHATATALLAVRAPEQGMEMGEVCPGPGAACVMSCGLTSTKQEPNRGSQPCSWPGASWSSAGELTPAAITTPP